MKLTKKNRDIFDYKKTLLLAWMLLRNQIQDKAEKENFVDSGDFLRSIFVKEKWESVLVWSNRPQARVWEYGRKPWKYPSFNAITWRVIRKFSLDGKKTASYDSQPTKTKWIIFLVARKIKEKWIDKKEIFSWIGTAVIDNYIFLELKKDTKWTI